MTDLDGMEEVLQEFLVESAEGLDQFDQDMVKLEQAPDSADLIASVFRTIHTIKGTSGFLGFSQLESVTHVGENLLSLLRDDKLSLNAQITTALLRMGDAVRRILAFIEAGDGEGPDEDEALRQELNALAKGEDAAPATEDVAISSAVDADAIETSDEGDDHGEVVQVDDPESVPDTATGKTEDRPGRSATNTAQTHVPDASIRVSVGLLDSLMNLVGELVLARNQVLQHTAVEDNSGLTATTQRLNLITTELQEGVMKTRMQPIGNIWGKFPRVVRDLATACHKSVRIEMEGRETDLDRTIIEAIRDPLTHLIRNAVDHGIEAPADRLANGKPEEGTIQLRAYHEGGQVNIEIIDDGGGIDPARVRAKALERRIISAEQAAEYTDRECQSLIFAAGFSTAAAVTNVSGRGVGMDVVKTNIEKIGGAVDVKSTVGQGTTIRIKIPLTLAIIPALVVRSDGNSYAIPQVSLLELVRLDGAQAQAQIESIHGAPVYRLRGDLLPLAYLSHELGQATSEPANSTGDLNIVVLQADDRQFGLVVEEILDTEEIVVKPLGKQLKGIGTFAGTTIMGDGSVALILDVPGLAQGARVVAEHDARVPGSEQEEARTQSASAQTLLLIKMGAGGRAAIPISAVARLEEFPPEAMERSAGREVVQYRGEIMNILRLSDLLQFDSTSQVTDPLRVIVYSCDGQDVGIVVDNIIDIVDQHLSPADSRRGAAVIHERVTDILDLESIIRDQVRAPGSSWSRVAGEVVNHG